MNTKRIVFCLLLGTVIVSPASAQYLLNYADYMYITKYELTMFNEILWFTGNDTIYGDVYSYDYIGMSGAKGQPHFFGQVSTYQNNFIYIHGADPYFEEPPVFNSEPFYFPDHLDSVRYGALLQGNYFPNDSEIRMSGRLTGSEDGWVFQQWQFGIPFDSTQVSATDTIQYQENNWLTFFFEGDIDLECEHVLGKNLIAAAGNIRLIDNVLVEGATTENLGIVESDNENLIYLASEQNVRVADTYANGRGNGMNENNSHDRSHIVISAGIMTLGESFSIEHHNDAWNTYRWCDPEGEHAGETDERGAIYFYGALAQYRRGYVHRSNCGGTGYRKQYRYDERWHLNAPPIFIPNRIDYNGILENDTLIVDSYLYIMPGDSLVLGPGAVLILRGNFNPYFYEDSYFGVEATADNPAWILQENNFSDDIFASLENVGEWDQEWANLNMVISCEQLTVTGNLNNCSIVSTNNETRIVCPENNYLTIENSHLDGKFLIDNHLEEAHLVYSVIEGRVQNETVLTVDHCTFVARGADQSEPGLYSLRPCSITNSFFFGDYFIPARIFPSIEGEISYSGCFGAETETFDQFDIGEGMVYADPLFVDPLDGDYHLTSESPLVDAGDPDSPLDPDGTRTDIGAFFYDWSQHNDVGDEGITELPQAFEVEGPWPNPFNGMTTVQVAIPQNETVEVIAFDVLGRELNTVYQNHVMAGSYSIPVDLSGFSAGVYFLQIRMGQESRVVKALLLK